MNFFVFNNNGGNESVSDRIVSQANSSFASSFFFLPEGKRRAVKTFYAFCRKLDDGVDDADDRETALQSIEFWKQEIGKMNNGATLTPLGEEIRRVIHEFDLSIENFELVIEGVETDLSKKRYETFEELYAYCYRVASSVGFTCCEIMGVKSAAALRYAELTGIGVQLTNILRDIREDAGMGRIYLPLEDLERFNVSEEDILQVRIQKKLFDLLQFEAQRAETFFNMGQWILTPLDSLKLYFCHLLAGTYRAILDELRQKNFGLLNGKVRVPTRKMIRSAVKTAVSSTFGAMVVM